MVEVIRDRLLNAIVCCDIDPEREDCFDELDRQLAPIYNGTQNGWHALRPDNWRFTDPDAKETPFGSKDPWEACKPGPCADLPGRWHYVVVC
jgi:hypothetical protein